MFSREDLKQIAHILRPIRNRVMNTVARAVIQTIDEDLKMQMLQLGILEGEDGDDCENFQGYGFKSVPLKGAECVVVYPGGDRGVPLVVATEDRRHRPTGWDPGDAGLYNDKGAVVRLKNNGDIEVNPGPGGIVYTRSDGGTAEALVKKSEFVAHVHATGVGPSATPTVAIVGTTKLSSE